MELNLVNEWEQKWLLIRDYIVCNGYNNHVIVPYVLRQYIEIIQFIVWVAIPVRINMRFSEL